MYGNQNSSDDDKKRQQHTIEMQMVILESDNRKFINEKNMLDAEIRKLSMDIERLRVQLDEKRKSYEKVSYQATQNEEELKRLKKKLGTL